MLDRVCSIEPGRVTTYADLSPEAPRYAGAVLAACHDPDVPWQRVVRADGRRIAEALRADAGQAAALAVELRLTG